jgi:site-specific recombinase XerD
MFEGLRDAGYLVANPMRAVMKGFALLAQRLGIHRSFTEGEWAHVQACLNKEAAGVATDRLRCVLELLISSGIRLDELASATHADLRLETVPDAPPAWVLSVMGKGRKQRDVPLADDVVELLRRHEAHFEPVQRRVDAPLIRGLEASVPQWSNLNGELVKSSMTGEGGAALSAKGIYGLIKRFFGRAAQSAAAAGLDPKRFEHASTHWMRHTFVRQALVDGTPIEVVRDLVGHASIDTTSIYSTQELARKIRTVQGMKRRVAAEKR